MSWLRLDDAYLEHVKVADLTDGAIVLHLSILLYCARNRTLGEIATRTVRVQRGYKPSRLRELQDAGLIDVSSTICNVHHWSQWNPADPSAAQRMERYRARKAGREPSLQAEDHRNGPVTTTVTQPVTPAVTETSRTHAPYPQTKEHLELEQPPSLDADDDDDEARLIDLVADTDWTRRQLDAAGAEPGRAIAWLEAARARDGLSSPSGWAWQGFDGGSWPLPVPEPSRSTQAPASSFRDPSKRCADCGATFGEGHEPGCPRLPAVVEAEPVPVERDTSAAKRARDLLGRVTSSLPTEATT